MLYWRSALLNFHGHCVCPKTNNKLIKPLDRKFENFFTKRKSWDMVERW